MIRPDQQPGFWNEYAEPKSAVAKLVQKPLHQIDGHALANAYMKDFRMRKGMNEILADQATINVLRPGKRGER